MNWLMQSGLLTRQMTLHKIILDSENASSLCSLCTPFQIKPPHTVIFQQNNPVSKVWTPECFFMKNQQYFYLFTPLIFCHIAQKHDSIQQKLFSFQSISNHSPLIGPIFHQHNANQSYIPQAMDTQCVREHS